MPIEDRSQAPEAVRFSLLDIVRILRSAGGPLLTQTVLHAELARVEWAEEKSRLLRMLLVVLLGFACLLCALLFAGTLVLAVSWDTGFRIPALMLLILLFGFGVRHAWQRLQLLSAQGEHAFAATREEIAADIALLRSKL